MLFSRGANLCGLYYDLMIPTSFQFYSIGLSALTIENNDQRFRIQCHRIFFHAVTIT